MKTILSNKLYLTMLASDLLSNFGDILYYLALMNYVLLLPDAKFALSLIGLSEIIPIFSQVVLGYVADRTPNKVKTIIATQLFRALLYLFVGFSMTFSPALWIVMVAIVVNLFSDLAGQYENGLYAPVSLRVVSNEDREAAMGFSQALKTTCQVIFNGAGAVLISFMLHSHLAFVNAGTFALAAVIMVMARPKLNKLLADKPIQTTHQPSEKVHFVKDFRASIKLVIKEMFKIPEVKMSIIIVPAINGLVGGLNLLIVLMMKEDKNFLVINPSVTLAVGSISVLLGSILGNILAISALKKINLMAIIRLTTVLLILLYVSLLIHNAYLLLSVSFLLGVSSGAVNPKFNALIFNSLPEDKLALVSSGISTYFMAGMAFFQLLMSGLVLVLSADQISWLLLLLSLGLVAYVLGMKTGPQSRLSH